MTTSHYLLWGLILLPLAWYGLAALRRPIEIFAPPLLLSFALGGMYIWHYLGLSPDAVEAFLNHDYYRLLLLLAALCQYGFILGYVLARGAGAARSAVPTPGPTRPLLQTWCVALIAVGFVTQAVFMARSGGVIAFYSAPHGQAGAWEESSAYLYSWSAFMFPAVYLLLADRLAQGRQGAVVRVAFLLAIGYLVFEAFVFGNRGDTIRLALIFGLGYLILRPPAPGKALAVYAGLALALGAVLIFPHLRDALHLGAERELGSAIAEVVSGESEQAVNLDATGDELFFATALVEGASRTGSFDGGFGWLSVVVNFVPRFLWASKGQTGWFFHTAHVFPQDIGWRMTSGSAFGGIVDSFAHLSWLAPLLWFLFGCWGGRLWSSIRRPRPSIVEIGLFIAYMLGLTYWITQSFGAAFNGWFFFAAALWGLQVVAKLRAPALLPVRGQRAREGAAAVPTEGATSARKSVLHRSRHRVRVGRLPARRPPVAGPKTQ